jgi:mannose-6-phosphate isomerase-like protein (cupin superfamily)
MEEAQRALVLTPGKGRRYPLGRMEAVFMADGKETNDSYCASTWHVEANSTGPGPHKHDANEEVFFVIEGTMTFLVGDEHVEAPCGTFLRIPCGMMHDFENRTNKRAGVFNMFLPGGFETMMPAIVAWFREREGPM